MKQSDPLSNAAAHAAAFSRELDSMRAGTQVGHAELLGRLGGELPESGLYPERVVDELVAATSDARHGSAGGRFFAWVIGGGFPSAVAADWLASVWDENAAHFAGAPAASVIEEVVGEWLKDLFRLPAEASFALTSGCQMAHFTCLASAREALMRRCGWDVNRQGLAGAPVIRILSGVDRHASVDRALRFLGLGSDSIVTVEADDQGRIHVDALANDFERTKLPTIVVLSAGELNTGSFDRFDQLIPLAKTHRAWVHIDGAFGIVSRSSEQFLPLSDGLELADSWATDGHKWLNVPLDSGLAFVRDRDAHRRAMSVETDYLEPCHSARDAIDWTPEWSRRARGYALYAAIREQGRGGIEKLVDRCCQHAANLVDHVGRLPGVDVAVRPTLNQGLLRFLDPRVDDQGAHDEFTDQVIHRVNQTGEAFFGGTTWRGKRVMRVSVVNWRTSEQDVRRAVGAIERVLHSAAEASRPERLVSQATPTR
ncbi:MAG: pyridoxal-dependent decarboxylase [Planctomycetota bacterium]